MSSKQEILLNKLQLILQKQKQEEINKFNQWKEKNLSENEKNENDNDNNNQSKNENEKNDNKVKKRVQFTEEVNQFEIKKQMINQIKDILMKEFKNINYLEQQRQQQQDEEELEQDYSDHSDDLFEYSSPPPLISYPSIVIPSNEPKRIFLSSPSSPSNSPLNISRKIKLDYLNEDCKSKNDDYDNHNHNHNNKRLKTSHNEELYQLLPRLPPQPLFSAPPLNSYSSYSSQSSYSLIT